jgi:predicted dehydrogenase
VRPPGRHGEIDALDRLVWLMQAPVESVAAMSAHLFHDQRVADADQLLLRFRGGGLGIVASIGYRDTTMVNDSEIACEDGVLRVDPDGGASLVRAGRWEQLPGSAEPDWMLRALERKWREMRAAIRDGVRPSVGAAEAGSLVAVIESADAAARTGRETPVPPWTD